MQSNVCEDGAAGSSIAVRPCWMRWLSVLGGLALYLVMFLGISLLLSIPLVLVGLADGMSNGGTQLQMLLGEAIMLVSSVVAAWGVFKVYKKPFSRLGLAVGGRVPDVLAAFGLAVVLYAAGFGVSLMAGWVEVEAIVFHPADLLLSLLFFLLVGVYEEVTVRGFVLGSLLDAGVNRFVALGVTSLLFSAMHLANPGLGVLPLVNLALAGLLLGASYIYTRNLWFPIVLHWFWNYLQGPVLGYEVSGTRFADSLFRLRLSGSDLLTGGAFGFEGSLLCTILLVAGTAGILCFYECRRSRRQS